VESLVALLVALVAASVALVGIVVQQRATNRHRFTDRKQSLYVDFWIECKRHYQDVADHVAWQWAGRPGAAPLVGSTDQAERAILAMDILANRAVRKAARELFKLTVLLGRRFAREDEESWQTDRADWDPFVAHWEARAKDYLELAHLDLRDPA
jgi:hypothetical protein